MEVIYKPPLYLLEHNKKTRHLKKSVVVVGDFFASNFPSTLKLSALTHREHWLAQMIVNALSQQGYEVFYARYIANHPSITSFKDLSLQVSGLIADAWSLKHSKPPYLWVGVGLGAFIARFIIEQDALQSTHSKLVYAIDPTSQTLLTSQKPKPRLVALFGQNKGSFKPPKKQKKDKTAFHFILSPTIHPQLMKDIFNIYQNQSQCIWSNIKGYEVGVIKTSPPASNPQSQFFNASTLMGEMQLHDNDLDALQLYHQGYKDYYQLPPSSVFISNKKITIHQIDYFLEHGFFKT